jgi:[ribosomal protein S18]-alanine N-acetyltransferase
MDALGNNPAGGQLRPLRADDLERVTAIEAAAYSHPWTRGNFLDSLASGYLAQVCTHGEAGIVAYSVVMPGVDEDHLLNLTVDRAHLRRGWGSYMLERVIDAAILRGARGLWLEVRASNAAALALYDRFGFVQTGRRRDYYPAAKGREDAVLMSLVFAAPSAESV